jgi:hypothetical protein
MNDDAVSQSSEKIITIISEFKKTTKADVFEVQLIKINDCEPPKLRLKLDLLSEKAHLSQIVSDCLSPDDIVKIFESVHEFCKQSRVKLY